MARGLMILANYTWSKSLDDLPPRAGVTGFDTSSALPWDDPNRHRFDYGPSEFDHTHRFVLSYVWQLPTLKGRNSLVQQVLGGWQLTGLMQAQTGRPVTVNQGTDISGTGIGQDRGSFNGANPYAAGACAGIAPCKLWLNAGAFKVANDPTIKNTFGIVGKGALRFPAFMAGIWGSQRPSQLPNVSRCNCEANTSTSSTTLTSWATKAPSTISRRSVMETSRLSGRRWIPELGKSH